MAPKIFDSEKFFGLGKNEKLTNWIVKQVEGRFENQKNLLMVITGQTGSGKSYCAIRLGQLFSRRFNVPFTVDQILFNPMEFFKLVQVLPSKSTILFDEGSIDGSEKIPFEYNGELRVDTMESIYKNFCEVPSRIKILSTDLKKELWTSPSKIIAKPFVPGKRLYRITTETGRTITGTSDHSFIVKEDGIIKIKKGNCLKLGMEVPVAEQDTSDAKALIKWEKITRLKETQTTSPLVYDFSVPGMETFSNIDGIFVHNSITLDAQRWMSVDAKEEIPILLENDIKIRTIEKIYDDFKSKPEEIKILATDFKKPLWLQPYSITRHKTQNPNEKLIKITTESGRTITGTKNHSFIVKRNGIITTVRGDNIKAGDIVPVGDIYE